MANKGQLIFYLTRALHTKEDICKIQNMHPAVYFNKYICCLNVFSSFLRVALLIKKARTRNANCLKWGFPSEKFLPLLRLTVSKYASHAVQSLATHSQGHGLMLLWSIQRSISFQLVTFNIYSYLVLTKIVQIGAGLIQTFIFFASSITLPPDTNKFRSFQLEIHGFDLCSCILAKNSSQDGPS